MSDEKLTSDTRTQTDPRDAQQQQQPLWTENSTSESLTLTEAGDLSQSESLCNFVTMPAAMLRVRRRLFRLIVAVAAFSVVVAMLLRNVVQVNISQSTY